MDVILGDIPHTFVYIDNILVASGNPKHYLKDLKRVFQILDNNVMVVNCKKTSWAKPLLNFSVTR